MKITYYNTSNFSQDENASKEALNSFFHRLQKEALPFSTLDFTDELIASVEKASLEIQNFKHMLLLGVGGSTLGPQALQKSFAPQNRPIPRSKQLWVADNVDTSFFSECLNTLPPEETLILVISKSGSTLETMSQYFICKEWIQKELPKTWQKHFFIITDQQKGFLREEVKTHTFKSLPVPEGLGGRFSIFCAVGILPSAFLGLDYKQFLQGAKDARNTFFDDSKKYLAQFEQEQDTDAFLLEHSLPTVFKMAHFAFEAMEKNFSQLIFFNYLPKWSSLGAWFRQLWSESLGKQGNGSTPIPAIGATDQHSILQLFLDGKKDKACIFLKQLDFTEEDAPDAKNIPNSLVPTNIPSDWKWIAEKSLSQILEAEAIATRTALIEYDIPMLSLESLGHTEYDFGKLMWNLGMVTILTAYLLDINPFDQPAVEESKALAKKWLSEKK